MVENFPTNFTRDPNAPTLFNFTPLPPPAQSPPPNFQPISGAPAYVAPGQTYRPGFNVPATFGGGGGGGGSQPTQTKTTSEPISQQSSSPSYTVSESERSSEGTQFFKTFKTEEQNRISDTKSFQPSKTVEQGSLGSPTGNKPVGDFFERVGKISLATGETLVAIPVFALTAPIPLGGTEIGKRLNQSVPGSSFGTYPFQANVETGQTVGKEIASRGFVGAGLFGLQSLSKSFQENPERTAGTTIGLIAFPGAKSRFSDTLRVAGTKEIPLSKIAKPENISGQEPFPITKQGGAKAVLKEFKENPYAYEKDYPSMYHTTSQPLKGKVVIGEVSRRTDAPVMYGSPSVSTRFARVQGGEFPKFTLLSESPKPTIYSERVTSFERIPSKVRLQGLESMNRYLIEKQGGSGKAFITPAVEAGIKIETEAGVARGNIFRDVTPTDAGLIPRLRGFKEYTTIGDRKVPIRVTEFIQQEKPTVLQRIESKRVERGFRESESYARGESRVPVGKYPGLVSSVVRSSPRSIVSSAGSIVAPPSRVLSPQGSGSSSYLFRELSVSLSSSTRRLSSRVLERSGGTSYGGYSGFSQRSLSQTRSPAYGTFRQPKTFFKPPKVRPLELKKTPEIAGFRFVFGREFEFAKVTAGRALR